MYTILLAFVLSPFIWINADGRFQQLKIQYVTFLIITTICIVQCFSLYSIIVYFNKTVSCLADERFQQLTSRSMYVYNVTEADIHFHYICVTLNKVTGDVKYSDPASIYVLGKANFFTLMVKCLKT